MVSWRISAQLPRAVAVSYTHLQALENGLIRSRHLDDKASVAVLFALLKEMKEREMIPAQELLILITNFEEVGFGASYLPEGIPELLVVDMGAVGDDLDLSLIHI